jgi:hypothetical protein
METVPLGGKSNNKRKDLPRSNVYEKWAVIETADGPKVAFLTTLFGGGIVPGPANGARGHWLKDDGTFSETVVFKQATIMRTWVNQPTARILERFIEKLAA